MGLVQKSMEHPCNRLNSKQPCKILFLKNLTAWENAHIIKEKGGQNGIRKIVYSLTDNI